jgi:hypothetical protein
LVGAALAVSVLGSYSASTSRSEGPTWSAGLDRAADACPRGPADAVEVPITPKPFFAFVPCDRLADPSVGEVDQSP